MDYKNLSIRILSSFIFIIMYFTILFYYTDKIIYFITLIYFLICLEVFLNFKKLINIIIFYISISYLSIAIYISLVFNLYEFTAIILVIICFDSSCYLFGKTFGKNKILNKISPNKTYEGLFGGIIFTNLISLIFYLNFDIFKTSMNSNVFFFINIIILFSFFGDFIQSYFKRLNNIKDSSNFLPGHGGFFDRFDSFLLVVIPFSIHRFLF
tara:strand:+ start:375 stop:1007 length:633 start_codon:yes stop_codon:yes gene_type:complete